MSEENESKPYNAPRWHEPIAAEVIGHVEFTEEEKTKNKKEFREFLRKKGILKEED